MIHAFSLEHWFNFSILEQLANVGCDVDRALSWKHKNPQYSKNAFDRALELLDLTIADPKNKKCALKELLRVWEAWIDYFLYENEYGTTEEFWRNYFYNFNYAAALLKGK